MELVFDTNRFFHGIQLLFKNKILILVRLSRGLPISLYLKYEGICLKLPWNQKKFSFL